MADADEQRLLAAKQRRLAAELHLPEYKVISLLGRGTYAHVWKCLPRTEPEGSTRFVAVKQIAKAMTTLEWVLSEIHCMHKLHEPCPHFVELTGHRWEKNHDYAYLIMEYCDVGDLENYIQRKGRLSEQEILAIFRQIGEAMRIMKTEGIIHRDIKPNNILLCRRFPHGASALEVDAINCHVKLADFGTAKMADTSTSPNYGTTDYWAPEAEPTYNAQCDMFSLGIVLYQCLTRKLPFQRASNVFGQDTASISSMASDQAYEKPARCSKELGDLIERLLVAIASKRLSAEDFLGHPFFSKTYVPYTIAILGAPGAGKTALCRKFVNGDFCDHSSEPHWPIKKFSTAEFKINMRVVEPSALYPYMDKTLRMPWKCDAAIIVYDVTDARYFNVVRQLWNCIGMWDTNKPRAIRPGDGCVIAVVGTKMELASSREVTSEEASSVAREVGAFHAEISTKTGDGVQELFNEIGNRLLDIDNERVQSLIG